MENMNYFFLPKEFSDKEKALAMEVKHAVNWLEECKDKMSSAKDRIGTPFANSLFDDTG